MSGVKSTAKLKFSVKFKSLYSLWSGIIFHVLIKIFGFMTFMEIGNHSYYYEFSVDNFLINLYFPSRFHKFLVVVSF